MSNIHYKQMYSKPCYSFKGEYKYICLANMLYFISLKLILHLVLKFWVKFSPPPNKSLLKSLSLYNCTIMLHKMHTCNCTISAQNQLQKIRWLTEVHKQKTNIILRLHEFTKIWLNTHKAFPNIK